MTRGRSGVTVVEALVALLLLLLVVTGALSMVAAQRSAAERTLRRSEALAAERLVRTLLREETAGGRAGVDWWVQRPGVLALRAWRSWGVACPEPAPGGDLLVEAGGIRTADPAKDSVAVLGADGIWRIAALALREPDGDPCPAWPERPTERWRLDPPPSAAGRPVLVRAFERGSYHLEDGAFRYRRGEGGRQPLTPAVLDPDSTGIDGVPGGARVRVGARAGGGRWTLRLGGGR